MFKSHFNFLLIVTILSVVLLPVMGQQPSGMKLAKVEFEGLQRLSKEQLLQSSGLALGQDVNETILDAAAQRLLDSGLIKKLGYSYRPNGNQATVIFQIEEVAVAEQHRVIFDNFSWFS